MADQDSCAGSRYASTEILAFVNDTHAAHDAGLRQAFEAPEAAGIPAIQVGASEGKMLTLLMGLVGARKVVEVGTLVGYSAVRIARALPAGGKLVSLELDPHHADVARQNIAAAGLSERITVLVGAARDLLAGLEKDGPYDAVFVDADKASYDHYGRWAAANLRKGGLLIGDNAYLFGRLMEDTPEGAAMRRFHTEAATAFDSVCIPTPDGMLLGIKR